MQQILSSRTFARSGIRCRNFLSFVVNGALDGRSAQLKETTIAIVVFGETVEYNSAETSRVRVAAADLRRRLAVYYRVEGQFDSIEIQLPVGGYVPMFVMRPVRVRVGPFDNWTLLDRRGDLSSTVAEELAAQLAVSRGLRIEPVICGNGDLARFQIRGSFIVTGNHIRLTYAVVDLANGSVLSWSIHRRRRDRLFELCRSIASDLRRGALQQAVIPVSTTDSSGK